MPNNQSWNLLYIAGVSLIRLKSKILGKVLYVIQSVEIFSSTCLNWIEFYELFMLCSYNG